jgi:hypothetical protein
VEKAKEPWATFSRSALSRFDVTAHSYAASP